MLAAVVVAGVVIGAAVLVEPGDTARQRAYWERYIAEMSSAAGGGIVVIGDSRIKQALEAGPAWVAATAAAGMPAGGLIRLVAPVGPADLAGEIGRRVVEARPALIVVQLQALRHHMLCSDPLDAVSTALRRPLQRLIGRTPAETGDPRAEAEAFYRHDDRERGAPQGDAGDRARRQRTASASADMRDDVRLLLQAAAAAGIPALVVDVPAHASWDAHFATEMIRDRAVADGAVADGQAVLVSCPITFDRSDYTDLAHMSASGRRRYTAWLCGEIALRMRR